MDRRTALKNLSLSLGYAVATPTMISILQSCSSDTTTWTPSFFTKEEGFMITQLSDIILPSSETVGAINVLVPQFIDKMFDEVLDDERKMTMKEGATAFAKEFKSIYGKDSSKGSKDEFEKLLENYFKISKDQQEQISVLLKKDKSTLRGENLNTFLTYTFLTETRDYTLFGYYTSQEVGENILNYDPIPGKYLSCIPLEEAGNGNVWAYEK